MHTKGERLPPAKANNLTWISRNRKTYVISYVCPVIFNLQHLAIRQPYQMYLSLRLQGNLLCISTDQSHTIRIFSEDWFKSTFFEHFIGLMAQSKCFFHAKPWIIFHELCLKKGPLLIVIRGSFIVNIDAYFITQMARAKRKSNTLWSPLIFASNGLTSLVHEWNTPRC